MHSVISCTSLDQIRSQIDQIDSQLVALIARRGAYVQQAAAFKRNLQEVAAPQRVQQVISKVKQLAQLHQADPQVIEATWRAMIGAFIHAEQQVFAAAQASAPPTP